MSTWNPNSAMEWLISHGCIQRSVKTEKSKSIGFDIPGRIPKQVAVARGRQNVVTLYINAKSINEEEYPANGIHGVEIKETYLQGHMGKNGNPGIAGSIVRKNPSLNPVNHDVLRIHVDDSVALQELIKWYIS